MEEAVSRIFLDDENLEPLALAATARSKDDLALQG